MHLVSLPEDAKPLGMHGPLRITSFRNTVLKSHVGTYPLFPNPNHGSSDPNHDETRPGLVTGHHPIFETPTLTLSDTSRDAHPGDNDEIKIVRGSVPVLLAHTGCKGGAPSGF